MMLSPVLCRCWTMMKTSSETHQLVMSQWKQWCGYDRPSCIPCFVHRECESSSSTDTTTSSSSSGSNGSLHAAPPESADTTKALSATSISECPSGLLCLACGCVCCLEHSRTHCQSEGHALYVMTQPTNPLSFCVRCNMWFSLDVVYAGLGQENVTKADAFDTCHLLRRLQLISEASARSDHPWAGFAKAKGKRSFVHAALQLLRGSLFIERILAIDPGSVALLPLSRAITELFGKNTSHSDQQAQAEAVARQAMASLHMAENQSMDAPEFLIKLLCLLDEELLSGCGACPANATFQNMIEVGEQHSLVATVVRETPLFIPLFAFCTHHVSTEGASVASEERTQNSKVSDKSSAVAMRVAVKSLGDATIVLPDESPNSMSPSFSEFSSGPRIVGANPPRRGCTYPIQWTASDADVSETPDDRVRCLCGVMVRSGSCATPEGDVFSVLVRDRRHAKAEKGRWLLFDDTPAVRVVHESRAFDHPDACALLYEVVE